MKSFRMIHFPWVSSLIMFLTLNAFLWFRVITWGTGNYYSLLDWILAGLAAIHLLLNIPWGNPKYSFLKSSFRWGNVSLFLGLSWIVIISYSPSRYTYLEQEYLALVFLILSSFWVALLCWEDDPELHLSIILKSQIYAKRIMLSYSMIAMILAMVFLILGIDFLGICSQGCDIGGV